MNIYDTILQIDKFTKETAKNSENYLSMYKSYEFIKLLNKAEKNLKTTSMLLISQRDMLLALYEAFPSLPQRMNSILFDAFQISVVRLEQFKFPVYKISLPFLLPNKREKKAALKNAITDSVIAAVKQFCQNHSITPFSIAHIFIVSSYDGEYLNVDNDNKESVTIINGLIGNFIRDDRSSRLHTTYYSKAIESGAKTEIYITDVNTDEEVYGAIKRNII